MPLALRLATAWALSCGMSSEQDEKTVPCQMHESRILRGKIEPRNRTAGVQKHPDGPDPSTENE